MGMNQGGAPQRGGGYTPVGPRGGGTRTIGGGGTQPDTPGGGGGVAMPAPSYNEQPIKMPVVQPPVTATDARATAPLPMGGGMTVPGFGGAPTVIPPGSGPDGYSPGAGLGQGPYPYTGPSGVNMTAGIGQQAPVYMGGAAPPTWENGPVRPNVYGQRRPPMAGPVAPGGYRPPSNGMTTLPGEAAGGVRPKQPTKPSYGFPQLPGPNNPTTRYPGR